MGNSLNVKQKETSNKNKNKSTSKSLQTNKKIGNLSTGNRASALNSMLSSPKVKVKWYLQANYYSCNNQNQ